MHPSALINAKLFVDTYYKPGNKVIDIGSQDINGSLRDVFPDDVDYLGIDFVEGKNVDLVIDDPYQLPLQDNAFDIIVCSSCFEHSEFFWLVINEMARVLKPSGIIYLNVPQNGFIHRHPVDCWRFYPDSGLALCNWLKFSGYEEAILIESYASRQLPEHIITSYKGFNKESLRWNDFVCVIIKNEFYLNENKKRMKSKYDNSILNYISVDENGNYERNPEDYLIQNNMGMQIQNKIEIIKEVESELNSCKEAIKNMQDEVSSYKKQVTSILSSTSWKITKPMRFIVDKVKRL